MGIDYPYTRLPPETSGIVDTAPPIYIMVAKLRTTICPPPSQFFFTSQEGCAVYQFKREHSLYIRQKGEPEKGSLSC
jgi:hypothetical protein